MLIDAALSPRLALELCALGYQAFHVRELGMATATDPEILARASAERLVIVSRDADFAGLLAQSNQRWPSFVHLRMPNLHTPEAQAKLIVTVLERAADELATGAIVAVQRGRIRVRSLPLFSL